MALIMSELLRADSMGPVDVAVIEFDGGDVDSEVASALANLQDSGTVRIIDVAFVSTSVDGSVSIMELADDGAGDDFCEITDSPVDLLSESELRDLGRTLAPDSSAMVVVWENCWAARFASEIRESHGRLSILERIPHENVERAIAALGE